MKLETRKQGSLQIPQCYNVANTYKLDSSIVIHSAVLTDKLLTAFQNITVSSSLRSKSPKRATTPRETGILWSFEKSVTIFHSSRHNNPQDLNLQEFCLITSDITYVCEVLTKIYNKTVYVIWYRLHTHNDLNKTVQ